MRGVSGSGIDDIYGGGSGGGDGCDYHGYNNDIDISHKLIRSRQ